MNLRARKVWSIELTTDRIDEKPNSCRLCAILRVDGVAHDGPSLRAPEDLLKSRGLKRRNQARVDEWIRHATLLGLDRISLNDPGALLAGIGNGSFGQLAGDALAPVGFGDEKAGDGPDRLGVDSG